MNKLSNVWVFCDTDARYADVIAAGTQIGEQVSVFVLGGQDKIKKAFSYGATVVYDLGEEQNDRIIEDYALTIAQTIKQKAGSDLVLLPATRRGKALAGRLGVQLTAGVINDASSLEISEEGVKAEHMIYGGLALGAEKIDSKIAIVTLGGGVFDARPADDAKTGDVVKIDFVAPPASIKCIERRAKEQTGVDLSKAKRVVGIGRGISEQADIELINELCVATGAELGCTRPIAEGEKWLEKERYIGVSGVMLKPEVYLALGISGQIQHMAGVNTAQTIIAVNKDKNAPIFQYADYGLVGDLYKVIPALMSALKG